MDPKTWLWRKKSSDKTTVATDKVNISLRRIDEEVQMLPAEREVRAEKAVKNLNENLTSIVFDCHAKDDFVTNCAKKAPEAIADQEKAEAEAIFLKKELDEALRQGVAAKEKLTHSDAALKECMQQLDFLQDEQERRIHDVLMKASSGFEKAQKALEEKLTEANKRLEKLGAENFHLSNALLVEEKLVEDLHKCNSQTEAEFNALMARLCSTEKENAFLKYEFHILEKGLEIRNEEMEYNRQSADLAHKQHLESVRKITKLEAECQRLRFLMQKRLPGPAAMLRIKNEVEMLGRDQTEMRRRKMNPTRDLIVRDSTVENSLEFPSNKANLLIEQLRDMQEENKTLKEIMIKKNTELHSSRLTSSRTASRLAEVEAQLKELSKGQKYMELARCSSPISNELSRMSSFDIGSDDGVSSSGSWASALISELEHFRDGKLRNLREHKVSQVSDMSLMDDFVEMEKLAIISVETPSRGKCHPSRTSDELVPVVKSHSGFSDVKQIHSKDLATEKSFDWLQVVLNAILEQKRISKRGLDELLEDIRIALGCMNHRKSHQADALAISTHSGESDPLHISGYITWKSPNISPVIGSLHGTPTIDTLVEKTSNKQFNLSRSISKIIKLIEGINITSSVNCNTLEKCSVRDQSSFLLTAPADYFARVFHWRRFELHAVLQQFIHACNEVLNGKANLENFSEELSSALDWILNNYVDPKDASSTRDKIKKHFGWDKSHSQDEVGARVDGLVVESDTVDTSMEQSSCLKSVASSNDQNFSFKMERTQCNLQEENRKLKDEMKNMEARLESAADKSEELMIKLQESEQKIGSLQTELTTLKESKEIIEDQIENQKSINEDLDTQLTVAKAKLNGVFQKFSSLEVELEYRNNCCEELEGTCLELQLQLESVAKKEPPTYDINQEAKQSENGWELTAASAKLAECQETILNLGKQLKAMASPHDAVLIDKDFSSTDAATTATNNKKFNKWSSLRDQMLAEDGPKADIPKSLNTKGTLCNEDSREPSLLPSIDCNALVVYTPNAYPVSKNEANSTGVGTLAIVPSMKQSVGFLRKLLLRRKKGSSK